MSSAYVRTQIKEYLAANAPTESVIDLTGVFQEITELLGDNEIQPDAPWLGLEFIGNEELPIALAATNDQGKYRETGAVSFHVVDQAALGVGDKVLTRGEALRKIFRGARIGNVLVTGMTLLNFGHGATLDFEGGYIAGTFQITYESDLDLVP